MANCNVNVNLKEVKPVLAPIPDTYCTPILVANKEDSKQYVIIRYPNGALFFNPRHGDLTYCDDLEWLAEEYTFVRLLSESESVSFTGKKGY